MRKVFHSLKAIITEYKTITRILQSCTLTVSKQPRSSSKSKLKMTKSKPNVKYKSTKPMPSKGKNTFRNKSNI